MKALDTSVLIAAEKNAAIRVAVEAEPDLVIPAMAAAEFLVGVRATRNEASRLRAQDYYDDELRGGVYPFDEAQAQTLATIIAETRRKGFTIKAYDAAIAAAAVELGCPLIVADADFDGIAKVFPDLRLERI